MTFRHSFRLTLARCNIPSVFYPQIDIYPNLLHISEDFLLHNATCKNASIRLRESYRPANMIKSPCHMIQVTLLRQIRWRKARFDDKFHAHVAQT
jgi:hypothetical protein